MSLPPLAEMPPTNIRKTIAAEEWQGCIESWTTLAGLYLHLPPQELSGSTKSRHPLVPFLQSFYHENARAQPGDNTLHTPAAASLRRLCFALVQRMLVDGKADVQLLQFDFLADFCRVHARSTSLSPLLTNVWRLHNDVLQKQLDEKKSALLKVLLSASEQADQGEFRQLVDMMHASPEAGAVLMTGSDFLDALASQYQTTSSTEQKTLLVTTVYFGLLSLANTDPPHFSLLSDQLYSLKAQADKAKETPSLLADLVTNTPLTTKLRRTVGIASGARLQTLLDSIDTYRTPSIAQPRKHPHRRKGKGKGKAAQGDGEMHMHRMSLVTQVQDLFPDLGSGFVLKLLDEYNDNVEQVTAHLLDNSLPPHLRDLDRTEQAPISSTTSQQQIDNLAPRSTPPPPQHEPFIPNRRNAFDNDELDRLDFDTRKLHLGKRNEPQPDIQTNKAAILSALAAFDADDDERDDTYDVDDVGGTVDTAHPDGEPGPAAASAAKRAQEEENEKALFAAYRATPELFGRTFDVRRGQARQALKAETGMSDEQIEGWAMMLQRDPGRLKKLEARLGVFDSGQGALGRSAWRETDTEDSDANGATGRGSFGGRGSGWRGRGARGRGGSVAGPSSDPNTAKAQRNKETNKGSRANHNRRDQRAKKMARGGFSG